MPTSTPTRMTSCPDEIGVLLLGGDWAIAHGDAGGLANVAKRLSKHVDLSTCSELCAIGSLCQRDYEHAVPRWLTLRARIRDALTQATASRLRTKHAAKV